MKKTQYIELYNIIKKTKVTFIAIIIFVTMGLTFFFGLTWSGKVIENSADEYFSAGNLVDINVVSPFGFNDSDVDNFSNTDNVSDAEGFYTAYEFFEFDKSIYEVRIVSLTQKINTPMIMEGEIPVNQNEIALEYNFAKTKGIKVGDSISFMDSQTLSPLKGKNFTVKALMKTATNLGIQTDLYGLSNNAIPVNCLMFAPKDSFNSEYYSGYTDVGVRFSTLRKDNYFSDDYKTKVIELKNSFLSEISAMAKFSGFSLDELSHLISTSLDNTSRIPLTMSVNIFDKLKYSMAGLFVIIGLLVCYFAVSRIVYDNTTLIGTKKALGFTQAEIVSTYILYAGLGALIGSILGALFARFLFENILINTVGKYYLFNKIIYHFEFLPVLIFALGEILIQIVTVYVACRRLFKRKTLKLLQGVETPKAKKRFYEKSKLFNKLSLFSKTVINNFFNDKRRVISTIVGIGACASLVVCAITLNNNILGSFTKQYDKIYDFDQIVYYDSTKETFELEETLIDNGITNYSKIYSTIVYLNMPNGKNVHTYLYVGESDEINKIIHLYDLDGENYTFTKGVWSSCSYQEEFGTKVGENIVFTDFSSRKHEIKVDGFFEYYLLNNLLIMDNETFKEEFDTEFLPNAILLDSNGVDYSYLAQKLKDSIGFIFLSNDYDMKKYSFEGFSSVFTIIVAIYMLLAVAMAFLVLLNLFVMFVQEKKRELLTLKINGYSNKDAKRYIYLDTILLSVIGIILGLLFGTIMADLSLSAYKNESIYFISGINLMGCIIGIAFTAILTVITSLIALRKIKTFNLTSANE